MPEFILDMGEPAAATTFNSLDDFTQGYITAMFWTDAIADSDLNDESASLEGASFAELAPVALATIVYECGAWQLDNAALLQLAYEQDYTENRAGVDYWLTRNGHGAGFWDRDELKLRVPDPQHSMAKDPTSKLGDMLGDACRHGSRSIYRGDDGLIYYSQG